MPTEYRRVLKRLFQNWGVLAAAWLVVLSALAATLGLALLQAPPPPTAEPVAAALVPLEPTGELDQAAQHGETVEGETVEGEPAPEAAMTEPEPGAAATLPPAEDAHAPEGQTPEGRAEGQAEGQAAVEHSQEAPMADSHAPAGAAPEAQAAEGHAAAPAEAAAEAHAPAEPEGAQTTALPAPPPAKPDTPGETPVHEEPAPAGAAPAEPAPAGHAATEQAVAGHGGDSHGAGAEAPEGHDQVAAIPVIPPAPELLPYWQRYRQPFNTEDTRPRIAVVLTGLGLSDSATEAAINKLPPAITLSFSPYARNLERWIALARGRGHEVMIDLPMEPATFPNEDPGPQGLLTTLSADKNVDRLDWVLSRGSAYVGVAGALGSRFTASRGALEPVLKEVKGRGLIFLDRRTTEHSLVAELGAEMDLPVAINNRSVDERQASRVAIDARLAQIERIAQTDGYAVAMAQPYPVTLDRLAEWATELNARGLVIAPISALVGHQKMP